MILHRLSASVILCFTCGVCEVNGIHGPFSYNKMTTQGGTKQFISAII